LITAVIPGIGLSTTDLDLVRPDGSTICRKNAAANQYPIAVGYGKFQCWSRKENMGDDALAITLKHGDNSHECASEDTTKCQYF